MDTIWGFLRETTEDAVKLGPEKNTGLKRTGLDEYLKAIFPEIDDWVHDVPIGIIFEGKKLRTRPDYRSENLKIIVEFDGVDHYRNPLRIRKDFENTRIYETLGYKVVRIPYFIQLTRNAILRLFGIDVEREMFDGRYPSLGNCDGDPSYLCPAGIWRMAGDFIRFPDQYIVNLKALKKVGDEFLTGSEFLEDAYLKQNQ